MIGMAPSHPPAQVEHRGRPFCHDCWAVETADYVCSACTQKITDNTGIEALGKIWHSKFVFVVFFFGWEEVSVCYFFFWGGDG